MILGISSYYHDSAAALVGEKGLLPQHRRKDSPALSMITTSPFTRLIIVLKNFTPIFLALLVFRLLIILGGSSYAPFIYTFF